MTFKGNGVSAGIAIGKVLKQNIRVYPKQGSIADASVELEKLTHARKEYCEYISALMRDTIEDTTSESYQIFESFIAFAEDDYFFEQVEQKIAEESINADWALMEVVNAYTKELEKIEDEYIRQRIVDIRDIGLNISNIIMGGKNIRFTDIEEGTVFYAKELTPCEIIQMDKALVCGVVSEVGGKTSHVSIIARTKGIPAVMGFETHYDAIEDGDTFALNGETGVMIHQPSADEIRELRKMQGDAEKKDAIYATAKGQPSETQDGHRIVLAANIGNEMDVEKVLENDADGVGLFRTEFVFIDQNKMPTEQKQFEIYERIANQMDDKSVIVRTLDIGGDKPVVYIDIPKEENPFLGYRAMRICLDKTVILKTQLRAILRASTRKNLKIMFPMIACVEEVRSAKDILHEVMRELDEEGIEYDSNIPIGIMIEIPAAVMMSDALAKEVDFFSIGTNDLVQYMLAVDRGNMKVAKLYNHFNPAVIRAIKTVIENAHKAGIWVGVCGEAASDSLMAMLLTAMGIDELSVAASAVLRTRWVLGQLRFEDMQQMVDRVINMTGAEEIEDYLQSLSPKPSIV